MRPMPLILLACCLILAFPASAEVTYDYAGQFGTHGAASQLSHPLGVAADGLGNLYVADSSNHKIVKITGAGTFITEWGTFGTGPGEFNTPAGVALDGAGYVHVADSNNNRVQVFSPDGTLMASWGTGAQPTDIAIDGAGFVYVTSAGSNLVQKYSSTGIYVTHWYGGSQPRGIAIDTAGKVYVVSSGNSLVRKYQPTGEQIGSMGIPAQSWGIGVDNAGYIYVASAASSTPIIKFNPTGTVAGLIGSVGQGNGQFSNPADIVVDGGGTMLVADSGNNRVQRLNSGGAFLAAYTGTRPAENGRFDGLWGVAAGPGGTVYATDRNNSRVQAFAADGTFLSAWGTTGAGNGEFNHPSAIAVDSAGCVYVADTDNNRVQKFDPAGGIITAWTTAPQPVGVAADTSGRVLVTSAATSAVQAFTSGGAYIATWGAPVPPAGIAVDGAGNVYTTGPSAGLVWVNRAVDGSPVTSWSVPGSPAGIAVDAAGTVYVADAATSQVRTFTPEGAPLAAWGDPGSGEGQFNYPRGIAVDGAGAVYVADSGNDRVQRFVRHIEAPVATFTANATAGEAPLTIQFTDTSLPEPSDWSWSFGDGGTSIEQHPVHTYLSAGNYTVTLTVSNTAGSNATAATITVTDPPVPETRVPGTIEAEGFDVGGEGVGYHDATPGNSGGAAFRVNDDVDIAPLPGGGYAVTQIEDGEWLAYSIDGVTDAGAGYPYPVDLFVASDRDGGFVEIAVDGAVVRNVSVPNTGSPGTFTRVLTQVSLTAGGLPEQGLHTIRLRFHGDGTSLDRLAFWDRHPAMYADGWVSPAFVANRTSGPAPLAVQFTDTTRYGGYVYGWSWEFADGTVSSAQHPVHTFSTPGTYTVLLQMSEEDYWYRVMDGDVPSFGWYHHLGEPAPASALITVGAPVLAVPPGSATPTDPDADELYDDVNGNNRPDFADVVLYFNQMTWISGNEPVSLFDYNGNGRIDFADVVWLFNSL